MYNHFSFKLDVRTPLNYFASHISSHMLPELHPLSSSSCTAQDFDSGEWASHVLQKPWLWLNIENVNALSLTLQVSVDAVDMKPRPSHFSDFNQALWVART